MCGILEYFVNQPTLPSRSLLQGKEYTPSHKTDIRVLFAQIVAQKAPAQQTTETLRQHGEAICAAISAHVLAAPVKALEAA